MSLMAHYRHQLILSCHCKEPDLTWLWWDAEWLIKRLHLIIKRPLNTNAWHSNILNQTLRLNNFEKKNSTELNKAYWPTKMNKPHPHSTNCILSHLKIAFSYFAMSIWIWFIHKNISIYQPSLQTFGLRCPRQSCVTAARRVRHLASDVQLLHPAGLACTP